MRELISSYSDDRAFDVLPTRTREALEEIAHSEDTIEKIACMAVAEGLLKMCETIKQLSVISGTEFLLPNL